MIYANPLDLGAEETTRFLRGALPPPPAQVLEVGCGTGAVATRLKGGGHAVVGVDLDPDAVAAARERGVEAVESNLLGYRGGPFDAVAFTRSLHHVDALNEALDRAHALLKPGGLLLLEEFAVERMDADTARWFYELQSLLEATGAAAPDPAHEPVASSPLDRWFGEHDGDAIHTGEDMLVALGTRFEIQGTHSAPYLYRYVAERIEPSSRGLRIANWAFEVESMRVAERTLKAVGLRVVARRRR